jgi:hypothetical protein
MRILLWTSLLGSVRTRVANNDKNGIVVISRDTILTKLTRKQPEFSAFVERVKYLPFGFLSPRVSSECSELL